jgi:xanthine dehydrogenase accessory factor
MDFSLLDKIDTVVNGFVVTVVETKGHTYRKRGAKALFVAGEAAPAWGNLGSLCVDQEIVRQGEAAHDEGKPRMIEIDTSESDDVDFGYGTYCGGVMQLLLEPILDAHKEVYRGLRASLKNDHPVVLRHNLVTGDLEVAGVGPSTNDNLANTEPRPGMFAETIHPPRHLYIFGATPLTRRLAQLLAEMEFDIHVVDWRPTHLEGLMDLKWVSLHPEEYPFDADSYVLVQSHDFRRDKEALKAALSAGCAYVGMLSSSSRRDKMYEELRAEGVPGNSIDRISSPVGINIGGKSDAEIAVSIAAELVAFRNK